MDAWKIRLFGEFKLIRPNGRDVLLRNKKCEGLLAILAAGYPREVERSYAAAILWPEKSPEKQRENLRQAISIIRREAAPELIESTRSSCRLSTKYRYECDFIEAQLREDGEFMPGYEGAWFQEVRLQQLPGEPEELPSVMAHFFESLRWCARYDPKGLYAFLKVNPALVRGLSFDQLLSLLNVAGRPAGVEAWADYWRGVAENDLASCAFLLRRSLERATRSAEWNLVSDTCFELGKVYARQGDVRQAARVMDAADEAALRANTTNSKVNALRLRGSLLLHWGKRDAGLELLARSCEMVDEPVRRAVVESTQAWFEAASGLYDSALRRLEFGESLSAETGHQQAHMLTGMTRALLAIHTGPRTQAIPALERVADECYTTGCTQFGVYAEESMAKIHLLDHDPGLAAKKLDSANLNRLKARMSQTPLEKSMIAAIR